MTGPIRAKVYLGDGCYAEFDGYGIVLTTENGIEVTNRIVLEPEVYHALHVYHEQLVATLARERERDVPRDT